jgi:hypothetical protein
VDKPGQEAGTKLAEDVELGELLLERITQSNLILGRTDVLDLDCSRGWLGFK